MTNSSSTRTVLPRRADTSRSTVYFGGGTSICVTALMPMIGRLKRASVSAIERPPFECSRLCSCSRRHSRLVSSCDSTARSVCALIVSGFGKHIARPSGVTIVMSSERKRPPCSRSSRSTVAVLPVSVSADSMTPTPSSSTHAECRSIRFRSTMTKRRSASTMFV
jgi:hypothetical protein